MTKMIEISEERYEELLDYELWKVALELAKVHTWRGYEEALNIRLNRRDQ